MSGQHWAVSFRIFKCIANEWHGLVYAANYYCAAPLNRETFTRDHVIPRSLGGPTAVANLVCACRSCNQRKRDQDMEDFRRDCFGGERFYAELYNDAEPRRRRPPHSGGRRPI